MISKNEFLKVAQSVDGAYDDFVLGTYVEAKSEGCLREVFDFMTNNENISTDDVCELLNHLEGDPEPIRVLPTSHLQFA